MTATNVSLLENAGAVLLVEFINADQFPGQIAHLYPFLKGHCQARGIQTRWLRFGIATTNFSVHGKDAVTLSDPEEQRLLATLNELRPQVVFLTHELAEQHLEAVARALGPVPFVLFPKFLNQEFAREEPGAFRAHYQLDDESFLPDYRWEAGNRNALRRDRDNVYVKLRRLCGYRRTVTLNPLYADLELDEEVRSLGCAFCGSAPVQAKRLRAGRTPASWIQKQLEAIRDSFGPDQLPNALMFENLEHDDLVPELLAQLDRLGMRDMKLLFGMRVDRLLDLEDLLRRELPKVAERGSAIHIYVMGLESFVDDELLRMNKGFTALQAVRAVNLMRELETDFPESFHYSSYMPLAMILFTPWTRLEDLELNLGITKHLQIDEEVGNLFVARLRLHPDLAMTALADHDDLLVECVADNALLLNRRKLFGRELPWRFRDPRAELVNSFATRIEGDSSFDGDPLFELLREQKERHTPVGGWSRGPHVDLLRCFVAAALATDTLLDAETLLDEAFVLWRERHVATTSTGQSRGFNIGSEPFALPDYLPKLVSLLGEEKPLVSVPAVPPSDSARIDRARLAAEEIQVALRPASSGRPGNGLTLYLARQGERLARATELHRTTVTHPDADVVAAAHRELGALYGYPPCCSAAWSESRWSRTDLLPWALLAKRIEQPGPVSAWLNPLLLPDLAFVPCSMECDAAIQRYRGWIESLAGDGLPALLEQRAFLFALDGLHRSVSFERRESDDQWLHFDPATVAGDPTLCRQLAGGDRLRINGAQLQLWKGERIVHCWTAVLGLWDPRRAHNAEIWQQLATAAWRNGDPITHRARQQARAMLNTSLADPVTRSW